MNEVKIYLTTLVNWLNTDPWPRDPRLGGPRLAPAAIERALSIYQQLQERDRSVVVQARKILTRHVYAMIDQGENDEHRLTVGGLVRLRSIERDHAIKSASDSRKI